MLVVNLMIIQFRLKLDKFYCIERYKNLPQEEKDKIKEYQSKKYQKLVQDKKEALKSK